MTNFRTNLLATLALTAGLMAAGASQASQVFDFSYSGAGVSGSGVITTSDAGSPFTVTDIAGTANGETITGLSGYASADNLVYLPGPNLDFSGLSFSTASRDWGIGWTGSAYGIVNSLDNPDGACCGISPIEFRLTAAVPEPATWAMMLVGFGGLGVALRQRRRTVAAVA